MAGMEEALKRGSEQDFYKNMSDLNDWADLYDFDEYYAITDEEKAIEREIAKRREQAQNKANERGWRTCGVGTGRSLSAAAFGDDGTISRWDDLKRDGRGGRGSAEGKVPKDNYNARVRVTVSDIIITCAYTWHPLCAEMPRHTSQHQDHPLTQHSPSAPGTPFDAPSLKGKYQQ